MHYDIKYVKKRNHKEKINRSICQAAWCNYGFLKFFFTSFHTLQMLYKKNMHYFDLQDKTARNGRNSAPLHVIIKELEFRGYWRPGPDL